MTTNDLRALKHVRSYGAGGFSITAHSTGPTLAAALWPLALAGYLGPPGYMQAQGKDDWVGFGEGLPIYGTVALTAKGEEAMRRDG